MLWLATLAAAACSFALKLAGLSVPQRILRDGRVQRIAALLPIGLLAALVATQTFAAGRHLSVDARVAGVGCAVALTWRRAPFLMVVLSAAAVTALVRR
jgi:hypothetical protein